MFKKYKVKGSVQEGTVVFSEHTGEFIRFFDDYRRLCDRLAGLKYVVKMDLDVPEKRIITPENFSEAIFSLDGFRLRYSQYMTSEETELIDKEITILADKFLLDKDYQYFAKNSESLAKDNKLKFLVMYLRYLKETFLIVDKISYCLQESLAVSTKEIKKRVQFYDQQNFFINTFDYASEVSEMIAHLSYADLIEGYKKLFGYYYTFKYIIPSVEQIRIDALFDYFFQYLTHEDTIRNILKIKESGDLSEYFVSDIRQEHNELRIIFFNKIYFLINSALSERNIMPKTSPRILIDRTLI